MRGRAPREIQQSFERPRPELRAHEGEIRLRVRRVQADRHAVDRAFQFRGDVAAPDKVSEPVRIHADRDPEMRFRVTCGLEQHWQGFGRLTEPAEHQFVERLHIPRVKRGDDLLRGRLPLQPEARGLAHGLPGLPQTERAGAGAAVRQVHIEPVMYFIQYLHAFGHALLPFGSAASTAGGAAVPRSTRRPSAECPARSSV